MDRDFDEEIKAAENELSEVKASMVPLEEAFVSAAASLLREWYWDKASAIAKQESDVTTRIGRERISELQAEVRTLQEQTMQIAREFLGSDDLWWHKSKYGYANYDNSRNNIFTEPVQYAAGKLAPILQKYGYLSPGRTSPRWEQPYGKERKPMYPDRIEWSREMTTLLTQLEKLKARGEQINSNIKVIKKEKERAEAQSIWDQK